MQQNNIELQGTCLQPLQQLMCLSFGFQVGFSSKNSISMKQHSSSVMQDKDKTLRGKDY